MHAIGVLFLCVDAENGIGDEGAKVLAASLVKNSTLTTLNVEGTSQDGLFHAGTMHAVVLSEFALIEHLHC